MYIVVLVIKKKKCVIFRKTDETGDYYVKANKSGLGKQLLHIFFPMWISDCINAHISIHIHV